MLSQNDKIEPGTLKLQNYAVPPLVAGTYNLFAEVALDGKDAAGNNAIPAGTKFTNNNLQFTVAAPRFTLDPSLITSVYPAAGTKSGYHTSLPHIVFTRKTLPWERVIDATTGNAPWMSLLLLTEDEVRNNNITITDIDVTQLKIGDNIRVPDITIQPWETKDDKGVTVRAKVLEMPSSLFKNIIPAITDLNNLTHNRQVDMSNKENTDSNPKGWFSSIIGNRLPQRGWEDAAKTFIKPFTNFVYLVSLEGHGKNIAEITGADGNKRIRLIMLYQWSFTECGATFKEVVEALFNDARPIRMIPKDIMFNATPQELQDFTKNVPAGIQHALGYGYMPMNHERRTGGKSASWYRGPLVPVSIPNPEQYSYSNADQALRFDKTTGMFDISYASAWQLGRLMALQTKGFSASVNNWKSAFKRERPLIVAKEILQQQEGIDPSSLASVVSDAESDEILSAFLMELWQEIIDSPSEKIQQQP